MPDDELLYGGRLAVLVVDGEWPPVLQRQDDPRPLPHQRYSKRLFCSRSASASSGRHSIEIESGVRRAWLKAKPSTPCSSRKRAVPRSREDSSVTCSALEPHGLLPVEGRRVHEREERLLLQHPLELLAQVAPVEPQRLERVEISLESRVHRRVPPVDRRVVRVRAAGGEHVLQQRLARVRVRVRVVRVRVRVRVGARARLGLGLGSCSSACRSSSEIPHSLLSKLPSSGRTSRQSGVRHQASSCRSPLTGSTYAGG
eukprot:scaffold11629_cov63-Phaeocystis_antarctica.AAC.5